MGGMIVAFAIFIVGVKVGIQVERERVRIAEGVPATQSMNRDKKEGSGKEHARKGRVTRRKKR